MSYHVVYTTRSNFELQDAALWWAENRDAEQAARWLTEFQEAIASLASRPERHPLARENEAFDATLRELHFGIRGSATHRAVFEIREDKVVIHAIRHVAQRDITPSDLNG